MPESQGKAVLWRSLLPYSLFTAAVSGFLAMVIWRIGMRPDAAVGLTLLPAGLFASYVFRDAFQSFSFKEIGLAPLGNVAGWGVIGACFSFVASLVAILLVGETSTLGISSQNISELTPQTTILIIGSVLLLKVIPEELLFRGLVQRALRHEYPLIVAVPLQALAYCIFGVALAETLEFLGMLDDFMASWELAVFLFCSGVSFGLLRSITGNIGLGAGIAMVYHAGPQLITQQAMPFVSYAGGDLSGYFITFWCIAVQLPIIISIATLYCCRQDFYLARSEHL